LTISRQRSLGLAEKLFFTNRMGKMPDMTSVRIKIEPTLVWANWKSAGIDKSTGLRRY